MVSDSDCSLIWVSELPGEYLRNFPGSTPTAESVSGWYSSPCIFRKLEGYLKAVGCGHIEAGCRTFQQMGRCMFNGSQRGKEN